MTVRSPLARRGAGALAATLLLGTSLGAAQPAAAARTTASASAVRCR